MMLWRVKLRQGSYLAVAAVLLGSDFCHGEAPPPWWSHPETRIIETSGTANNYAPANLGQLKHVATNAKIHLDANLPGGSGSTITSVVGSFITGTTPDEKAANYAPLNLGQLKAVAKPFYDRLLTAGYDTRANLIARGYSGTWPYNYPWNPKTPVEENYAPANLGQLKMVFSFDLQNFDSDDDGLPDWWEQALVDADPFDDIESIGDISAEGNEDGDSLTNLQEWLLGLNPLDGSDALGRLTILSGDEQTVAANAITTHPLSIRAINFSNEAMPGATIRLRVEGDAGIRVSGTSEFASAVEAIADNDGEVEMDIKAGNAAATETRVIVESGFSPSAQAAIYTSGWLGIWSFDEGGGSVGNDHSSFQRAVNLKDTTWIARGANSAVHFSATSNNMGTVPGSASSLAINKGDMTLMAWIKTAHSGSARLIGQGFSGGRPGYSVEIGKSGAGRISAGVGDPAGAHLVITTTGTFNDNTWRHVALVVNRGAGSLGLLVDGVRQSVQIGVVPTGTASTTIALPATISLAGGQTLTLGREPGSSASFEGGLDEVRLYRGALSDGEIAAHVNESLDIDEDGLPDSWEQQIVDADLGDDITSIADVSPNDDFDGDGISNHQEYLGNTSPTDFYNGKSPVIVVENGDRQSGTSGTLLTSPVRIRVMNGENINLPNAPLKIVPVDPAATVGVSGTSLSPSTDIRMDAQGRGAIFIKP